MKNDDNNAIPTPIFKLGFNNIAAAIGIVKSFLKYPKISYILNGLVS